MNGALERMWKEKSELFWDVSKNLSGGNEHFSKHSLPSDRDSKLEIFPRTERKHSPVDATSDRSGDILHNYSLIIQVPHVVTMCRLTIFPRRFEGINYFSFQGLGAP